MVWFDYTIPFGFTLFISIVTILSSITLARRDAQHQIMLWKMNKAEKYSEKIFDKKVEIYGEINLQLSNLTDAWVLLIKNQYRDETLSFKEFRNKPFFIKSPSDFKSKDDLEKWYKTYYSPNNATIILVGDITRDDVLPKIKKYFEKIPKSSPPPLLTAVEPEQRGEKRVWLKREAQLPFFVAGYRAPQVGQEDVFPLEILESVLSSGRSSRLYKALVYDKQLAMYAGGSYDNIAAGPALFYLYAGIKPGVDVKEVEDAIYKEIEKVKENGITTQELQKAKNQLGASFIMGQDSIFYQAMLIGRLESVGVDHNYLLNYPENINKVSVEDVIKVAKKYFVKDKRTVGILVPERKGGK